MKKILKIVHPEDITANIRVMDRQLNKENILFRKNEVQSLIPENGTTQKLKIENALDRKQAIHQKLVIQTSIQAQEKERAEVGTELQENINQILASTKLYLEMALDGSTGLQRELLNTSIANIKLAIAETRRLSQAMLAPLLEDISLVQAIQDLVGNVSITSSLKLELKLVQYNEKLIDRDMKLMLYRIVQEEIINILKHSKATSATVQLRTTHDNIILTVRDKGIGFNTSKVPGGIGLRNITNRVGLYDGIIKVISSPGNGRSLKVTIPVAGG